MPAAAQLGPLPQCNCTTDERHDHGGGSEARGTPARCGWACNAQRSLTPQRQYARIVRPGLCQPAGPFDRVVRSAMRWRPVDPARKLGAHLLRRIACHDLVVPVRCDFAYISAAENATASV